MWGVRVRVQVSKREFHTHIYLNYVRIEFLSYIIIKNKKTIKFIKHESHKKLQVL